MTSRGNRQGVTDRGASRFRLTSYPSLVLFLSALLIAQEPSQLEPFRTEVNYIRVDMYPAADGKPVMDLRQDEIEILDEGVPQKIDRFEHVVVRGTRSQEARREPSTIAEMREATQDVRARLFVLFLDTEHVEFGPMLTIRNPLIQSLNELIGGDDLVAVMTAGMHARDITFRRRTTSIEALLKTVWSERDHRLTRNAEEDEIAICYPDGGLADEMIFRRREVRTLDALEELVRHLRFVREERKAVIAISQGWRLFGDDPTLRRPVGGQPVAPVPPLGNDPRTGRIGVVERTGSELFDRRRCEQERLSLSMLRNDLRFLNILREANTGNTSFYPVDPRGLVVFDENIVPLSPTGSWKPGVNIVDDSQRLRARNDSLRTMADVTDGIAVVQAGDLAAGMRRVVEDLRSYYLIGYYSTRELDGKFHRLTVRVKRPGIRVRARTGYLAATRGDEAKAKAAASTVAAAQPADARAEAVKGPLSALGIFSRERPLRVHVASGYLPSGAATIWGVAEIPAATGRHDWSEGGQADASLIDGAGSTLLTEHLTIAPGVRSLTFTIGSTAALAPGDYQVQIRAKGTSASLGAMESVRVSIQAPPFATGAVILRRGITTGNRSIPTADLRFRRTERITIEVPTTSGDAGTAQLLNRTGQSMPIPVTTALRDDADGARWRTAQFALAPLAPGDYVVEQSAGKETARTAIRVLP